MRETCEPYLGRKPTLVALAAVLATTLATAGPASATFPGGNGRIAIAAFNSATGASSIYTVDAHGNNVRNIRDCPTPSCTLENPSFSNGGRRIALTEEGRLATMNANGSGFAPIGNRRQSFPSWSFFGSVILVTEAPSGGSASRDLFTIRRDSLRIRRLTYRGGSDGEFSAQNQIAFVRAGNIHTMAADATGLRRLTGAGGVQPSWAPDGRRIAFVRNGNVHIIGSDGRFLRRLTGAGGFQPAFSPDGGAIAFARNNQVLVVRTDGTGLRPIIRGAGTTRVSSPTWQGLP